MDDQLRIGFVTIDDVNNRLAYSGTAHAMRQAFLAHPNVSVVDIARLTSTMYPLWRAKQAVYWFGFGKRYWMNRQRAVLEGYARQVARKTSGSSTLDLLFSPGSVPLVRYAGPLPTVFWSDATFDRLADFYPEASNFARETVMAGHRMERDALRNCSLAIYTSQWAADSAATTYETPRSKLETVSYGANIDPQTGPPDADDFIRRRLGRRPTRLLFVGGHWQRKGGDLAVQTVGELVNRGHDAALDIVGCNPPLAVPSFVTCHGFLNKESPAAQERLLALFREAHLLILPTRADCVPMVIAEAYAFGLPVAVTDVGGVASVVEDGVTGSLLPLTADAAAWATAVATIISSGERYHEMAQASLALFRCSLNWPAAVDRVVNLLQSRRIAAHAA